jgi:hypothetical protein
VSPIGPPTWGGLARVEASHNPELLVPLAPLAARTKLQWFDGVLYALEDGKVNQLTADGLVPVLQMDVLGETFELQVVDVDADGQPEIVRHDHERAWLWSGRGSYELHAELNLASDVGLSRAATWQDLDADGRTDLVVVESTTLRWFKAGAGLSLAEQPIESPPDLPVNVAPTWLAVNDLEADGDSDVVTLFRFTSYGEGEDHDSFVAVFVNEGDDETFTFYRGPGLGATYSVAAARPLSDIDSDGLADVIWATQGSLWMSRGLPDAGFAPVERIATNAYIDEALRVEDLDGDGKTDLLVRAGGSVSQLFNLGEGRFENVPLPRNLGRSVNVAAAPSDTGPALLYVTVEAEAENHAVARCEDEPGCICSFDTYCVTCLDDSACEDGECYDGQCVECDDNSDCAGHEACLRNACERVVSSEAGWSSVVTNFDATGCGIRDAQLICWQRSGEPIDAPLSGQFVQVVLTNDEPLGGCGLTSDGQVACWSGEERWQPNLSEEVTQLAAGRAVCALHVSGAISCFSEGMVWPTAAGSGFAKLSVSGSHGCALRDSGTAECWSLDAPLPDRPGGPTDPAPAVPMSSAPQAQPLDVPPLAFSAICAGEQFTCGIKSDDGAITCWGRNDYAQTFAPAGAFTEIACGSYLSCALDGEGGLECWGRAAWTPVGSVFARLSVAGEAACATTADGHFECNSTVP